MNDGTQPQPHTTNAHSVSPQMGQVFVGVPAHTTTSTQPQNVAQFPPVPTVAPSTTQSDTQVVNQPQSEYGAVPVVSQDLSQFTDTTLDTLNVPGAVGTGKERFEPGNAPDMHFPDLQAGFQVVEQEKSPEIPVEVESYLQRVEDHQETAPTEVVIADGTSEVPTNQYPSRPVIVLPINQKEEKEGAKKPPKFSFRWLVEFSQKIVLMYTGKVIYKPERNDA